MTFQRLASYAHVLAVFGKTNMMMIMMMMTRWSRYDWLATFTFSKSKLDFTMDLGPMYTLPAILRATTLFCYRD